MSELRLASVRPTNDDGDAGDASTRATVEIHDRVADAYFGKLGDGFMRDTQERIHWICSNVVGNRVLDIGCSQGITSLLLAREGMRVTGLDPDVQAIAEARRLVEAEPPHVQQNVSFTAADASTHGTNEEFDTVVLAEVLEHMTLPERLVRAAADRLACGGRLVVTVPFGINDFIDHKRTYYMREPIALLAPFFDIASVEVLGRWIGIVCSKRADSVNAIPRYVFREDDLTKLELGFYRIERALRDEKAQLSRKLDGANTKYRSASQSITALKAQLASTTASEREARDRLQATERQLTQHLAEIEESTRSQRLLAEQLAGVRLESELLRNKATYSAESNQRLSEQLSRLSVDIDALRQQRNDLEVRVAILQHEAALHEEALLQSKSRVEEFRTLLQQAYADRDASRDALGQAKIQLATAEQSTAQAVSQIASLEQRLALERANASEKVQTLERDHQVQRAALEEKERDFIRVETDLGAAKGRLDDANLKYRGAMEQIFLLKERLSMASRASEAHDSETVSIRQRLDAANAALAEMAAEREKSAEVHESEVMTLRQRLDAANTELAELTAEREKFADSIRTLEDDASRRDDEIARASGAALSMRASLAVAKRALRRERAVHRVEQKRMSRAVTRATAEQERRAARTRVALQREKASRLAEIGALRAKLLELDAAGRTLEERAEEFEKHLIEAAEERDSAKSNVLELRTKLHELVQALAAAEETGVAQQQRDASRLAQIEELRRELDARTAAHRILERSAEEASARFAAVSAERDAALARSRELEANITNLEQALAETRARVEAESEEARRAAEKADAELAASSSELDDARRKYRNSTAQAVALQATSDALRVELDGAENARRRTLDDLTRLKSEVETLQALRREQEHRQTNLAVEAVRQKMALAAANQEVERCRQQAHNAVQQAVKTRQTLAFQLGHALIFGTKSMDGLRALPHRLLEIRKEAVRRRMAKRPAIEATNAAAMPKTLDANSFPRLPAAERIASNPGADAPRATAASLKSMRVAAIMDEFTFGSYRDECNLLQLTPQYWQEELTRFRPELLFIESAWRGKDELWGSKVGHMSQELVGIVDWCREHRVPTVFWNKEDPVHFETFLNTAKLFDYVFTTDIDCIHRYKAALGHERVYLLPFAAQPLANNPVETYERKDAFCFAGAYYVRYPERTRDLGNFVATLSSYRPIEIYDRNFGKNDENYKFPLEYQPFIVGNLPFDQIDKAYKGYRYAINLNSIKQSQTMFARRVFELLACNTVTVSNFSRGVRLLFGDLVFTSDSGADLVRRLRDLDNDETTLAKFKLAALRKVMREHTYQDRLNYVVSKVRSQDLAETLPRMIVVAYARTQAQADSLLGSFARQEYTAKELVLVVPGGFMPHCQLESARIVPAPEAAGIALGSLGAFDDWLATMVPDDYYGPNYLLDLALATRYVQTSVIGKAAHYSWSPAEGLQLTQGGLQYKRAREVPARAGAARLDSLESSLALREWVGTLHTRRLVADDALSIDEFNYCKNASAEGFGSEQRSTVDDLEDLATGLSLHDLTERAEQIQPEKQMELDAPQIGGSDLAKLFSKAPQHTKITMAPRDAALHVLSALPDGKHEYWYATFDQPLAAMRPDDARVRFHLAADPGLNIQLLMVFLDGRRQKVSHVVKSANRNHEVDVPAGTEFVRLGLRVYASGSAAIHALILGHRRLEPSELVTAGDHLLLTNHYPSHDDLYRNGFVHRRVVAYRQQNVLVDVFRLRPGEALSYHEHENVDCITGSQEALGQLLAAGRYKTVLVHFLDEPMWELLKNYVERVRIIVWVHGAEVQPLHRREYNYTNDLDRKSAQEASDRRMAFWRSLLGTMPSNLHLVFVSQYFADEVMEDLGFRLPNHKYSIIHNPIDTGIFTYEPKPPNQRKKILSIRPYASAKYANDLSVKAILELSRRPEFNDFEFRMIGDGPLFDETLAPLRGFSNVHIERRFLSQDEIATLHKTYGLFLCPTRMDAQGVSRDEAMASGLVPLTNCVAAIPEFVDPTCGVLAPAEDHLEIARGLLRLATDEQLFKAMSEAAAKRVRRQTASFDIVARELELISGGAC